MNLRRLFSAALFAELFCLVGWPVPRLAATSMVYTHYHCALCGEDYVGNAVCPRCLYTPGVTPIKKFTKEEAARVRAAIASYPQSLAPAVRVRARLDKTTLPDGANEFTADLAARCDAAWRDDPLPTSTLAAVLPSRRSSSEDEERQHSRRQFQKVLPTLLEQQRQGQPVPRTYDDGVSLVVEAVAETTQGDAGAWEFFVRSLLSADEADVKYHSFDDDLPDIAAAPPLPWPDGIDFSKARIPLLIDSLRYIRDPRLPMPPSLRRELAQPQTGGYLFSIAVTACAVRRDRAAAPLLTRRVKNLTNDLSPAPIRRFYTRAGVSADIAVLAPRLRRSPAAGYSYSDDWEADCYADAVRAIQFRTLFAGQPPTSY